MSLPSRKGAPVTLTLDRRTDTAHRNAGQDAKTLALQEPRDRYGVGAYRRLFNTDGEPVTGSKGWRNGRSQRLQRDEKGHPVGPAPRNLSKVDLAVTHRGRARVLRVTLERPNRDIDLFQVTYAWID